MVGCDFTILFTKTDLLNSLNIDSENNNIELVKGEINYWRGLEHEIGHLIYLST